MNIKEEFDQIKQEDNEINDNFGINPYNINNNNVYISKKVLEKKGMIVEEEYFLEKEEKEKIGEDKEWKDLKRRKKYKYGF